MIKKRLTHNSFQFQEDRKYEYMILREYDMSEDSISVRRHNYNVNNKQIYEQLVDDEKVVLELQELLSDKDAKDIEHLFNGPNALSLAHQYIKRLYLMDATKPMGTKGVATCRRYLATLKGELIEC